jgi:hypothetical protein
MSVINLRRHKEEKKNRTIIEELTIVIRLMTLAQEGLAHFKHYIKVAEVISVLHTNAMLLDYQRKKIEKELKSYDKG